MPSKKSFFNRTLFLKNLSRFWPLWGGLSIAGAFLPLYMLIAAQANDLSPDSGSLAEILYQAVTVFAPVFLFLYAIVCVMLVWGYLYSPRAVGLMHMLPIDRDGLFVTNTLSSLAIMLIPFAVVGGLMSLVSLFLGFFSPVAVLNTVLAVLCLTFLFLGLAVFCAMLTGHIAALPVLYLLVNFLAWLLEQFVGILASGFLLGVSSLESNTLQFLSPLIEIMNKFRCLYMDSEEYWSTYSGILNWSAVQRAERDRIIFLEGFGTVALYGLAGIALLALAWLLYRKRRSECAGDVAAFNPLRPVFRFGTAALSALTLGRLLYEIFWTAIFDGTINQTVKFLPMVVCMALGGLVGFYIASMLVEKSLRVFRGSLKGAALVCAGVLALCTVLKLDPLHTVDHIPELDEIESILVDDDYYRGLLYSTDTEDGRQFAEQAMALHRAILEHKEEIAALTWDDYNRLWHETDGEPEEIQATTTSFRISYNLKNGGSLYRSYAMIVTKDRMEEPGTLDWQFNALINSELARLSRVRVPEGGKLLRVEPYYRGESVDVNDAASEQIYDALLQDAIEGNLPDARFGWWNNDPEPTFDVELEVVYTKQRENQTDGMGREYIDTKYVSLSDSMTHTVQALIDAGVYSEEQFAVWRQELEERNGNG